jgi:hypothetical protein
MNSIFRLSIRRLITLKTELCLKEFKNLIPPKRAIHCISITKKNVLIMFWKLISVYFHNHVK